MLLDKDAASGRDNRRADSSTEYLREQLGVDTIVEFWHLSMLNIVAIEGASLRSLILKRIFFMG